MNIPNIIHFVFGLSDNPADRQLTLPHYLAVKSASVVNRPESILFHYGYEPVGEWWKKIKPMVESHVVEVPRQIHGRPLEHYAHKSDVIRLEVLKQYGGIYLDLDTICVRPLTPFLKHQFVIGRQASIVASNWKQRMRICWHEGSLKNFRRSVVGLCNAVMLSGADNRFVNLWLDSYRDFRATGREDYWDEHSVRVPLRLAREHPGWAHEASEWAFHYPLYDGMGLEDLFVHSKHFPKAYVHHLWDSLSRKKYLNDLTIETIKRKDTTYNQIARRFL